MGNQQVEVKQAKFKTIVSEGSSLQGSQIASAVLTGMGDNINVINYEAKFGNINESKC